MSDYQFIAYKAVNSDNSDDNIRVVILSSSGKLFCAGADLKDSSMSDKGSEQHLMEDHFPILSANYFNEPKI